MIPRLHKLLDLLFAFLDHEGVDLRVILDWVPISRHGVVYLVKVYVWRLVDPKRFTGIHTLVPSDFSGQGVLVRIF